MRISKRKFLALTSTSLLSSKIESKINNQRKYDVIIIGAGLSGLNAAMILENEGLNILLLEGSSRIGGRVYTGNNIDGKPELGASQVGPFYGRVRDMANKLNIKLLPGSNKSSPYTFFINKGLIKKNEWENHQINNTNKSEKNILP